MAAMRAQDFARAVDLAEAARRAGAADACVFGLLGHALSILGRHADASEAYVEALKLAPEDVYVRHLVRASGLLPQSTRAPAAYVEAVFDGYADRFESHLIDLGYRVPGLIRNALRAHWPDSVPIGSVLDLGCGTGLVAVALSDFAIGRLTGVDLSSAMLAEARAKGLYHDLVHADLADMLTDSSERWDIILAADVLNYFGDLDAVLAGVASRLRSGGRFVASFELLSCGDDAPCENWRLHTQGRFAHAAAYVAGAACAAGLQVVSFAEESLRCETGVAVNGLLAVFGRGAH
jgi:predicted TPR repeat methyltransferase